MLFVEGFVLWLYFYQYEYTREDYSLVWQFGQYIADDGADATDAQRQQALNWFGFRNFADETESYNSIFGELIPFVLIVVFGVITNVAPFWGLHHAIKHPKYERRDGIGVCYLFSRPEKVCLPV